MEPQTISISIASIKTGANIKIETAGETVDIEFADQETAQQRFEFIRASCLGRSNVPMQDMVPLFVEV